MPSGPRPRVLLAGRHELSCALLDLLLASDVEVGIVTAASEHSGGPRASLKDAARTRGIAPLAANAGHRELEDVVRSWRPGVLLSAGFDRIVREQTLRLVEWPVNVHFGALPRYRGSFSIPWAILNGEREIGVTLHVMSPGIDDGPIVEQARFANDPEAPCRDLYDRAVRCGVDLVRSFLATLRAAGRVATREQDEQQATYHGPEYPDGFRIPWRQTTRYVRDYIRAGHFPPLPPAHTDAGPLRIGIEWPVRSETHRPAGPPGTIEMADGAARVLTLNGHITPGVVLTDGRAISFTELVRERGLVGARCA